MKKLFLILFALVLLLSLGVALADTSGSCGDQITWEITDDNVLILSGSGKMTAYTSYASIPWWQQRSDITAVQIQEGITSLSPYAFYGMRSLTEIRIPDSVASLGKNIFENCANLVSVSLGSGLKQLPQYAFNNCSSLKDVTLPAGIEVLERFAFYNCAALETLDLPEGLNTIDGFVFSGCSSLKALDLPHSLTWLGPSSFKNCTALESIRVPSGVSIICEATFQGCSALRSVVVEEGVKTISESVFSDCRHLENIVLPQSLTYVGDHAFSPSQASNGILLPNHITTWSAQVVAVSHPITLYAVEGSTTAATLTKNRVPFTAVSGNAWHPSADNTIYWSFAEETGTLRVWGEGRIGGSGIPSESSYPWYSLKNSIKHLEITGDVTDIGPNAFIYSRFLESVQITAPIATIQYYAFTSCSKVTSLTLPEGLISIGQCAFSGWNGLKTISFPSTLQSISANAFQFCPALAAVHLPPSLKSLGQYAFSDCYQLTEVQIDGPLTALNTAAFSNCNKLKTLILPDTLQTIGANAFAKCSALSAVFLPDGLTSIDSTAFTGVNAETLLCRWGSVSQSTLAGLSLGVSLFDDCGDNAVWILNPARDTVRIIGSGNTRKDTETLPWEQVTKAEISDGITEIGDGLFSGCAHLSELSVPRSVTAIGNDAFAGCTQLTSFSMSYIHQVGEGAFRGSGLTSVTFNGYFTEVPARVLMDCPDLTRVSMYDNVTAIGEEAFAGCVSLETVSQPKNLLTIGREAFRGCSALPAVKLPASLQTIGTEAFKGCSSARFVMVPNSVTAVGDSAFAEIPDAEFFVGGQAAALGASAFGDTGARITCAAGTAAENALRAAGYAPQTVDQLSSYGSGEPWYRIGDTLYIGGFGGYYFKWTNTNDLAPWGFNTPFTRVVVLDSVRTIGTNWFEGIGWMTEIQLPEGLKVIRSNAFHNCKALTEVTLPDGVSLETNAFDAGMTFYVHPGTVTAANLDAAGIAYTAFLDKGICGEQAAYLLLPDGSLRVTGSGSIAPHAFAALGDAILSAQLGADINAVGEGAFETCNALTDAIYEGTDLFALAVDKGNLPLVSCLLAPYKQLGTPDFILPESLTEIGDEAFQGIAATVLRLPAGLTRIGSGAFRALPSLRQVIIPDTVTEIAPDAFADCTPFLIIFGAPGSAAEALAEAQDWLFIPTP